MFWLESRVVGDENRVVYSISMFVDVIVTNRWCRGEFNYSGAWTGGIHGAGASGDRGGTV